MVYGLVSNLTAAALLAHAFFGCCWHHGHATRPAAVVFCTTDSSHAHGHGGPCGHDESGSSAPTDRDSHGPDGCEGGRCAFVTVSPVRAPGASEPQPGGIAMATAAIDAGATGYLADLPAGPPAPGHFPPRDSYLTLQVLLL